MKSSVRHIPTLDYNFIIRLTPKKRRLTMKPLWATLGYISCRSVQRIHSSLHKVKDHRFVTNRERLTKDSQWLTFPFPSPSHDHTRNLVAEDQPSDSRRVNEREGGRRVGDGLRCSSFLGTPLSRPMKRCLTKGRNERWKKRWPGRGSRLTAAWIVNLFLSNSSHSGISSSLAHEPCVVGS